jgi:Putative dehydrogenase domain of multifunctional non-ribosomal peptide synthetases and related enzymes
MKGKLFITGFPGFIGSRLVRELLKRYADIEVVALVQQKFMHAAEATRYKIVAGRTDFENRFSFVFGDITKDLLGIADWKSLSEQITHVFHLAAAYDLGIQREVGMRINVEGTKNVVDFARRCKNLVRLDYVSTAYVSGSSTGVFSESDFDRGQRFKNYYEETKFIAEKVVRDTPDLPYVIYRPGIVVGDSLTGETSKYDGPYYVLQMMRSLPNYFPFPRIGDGSAEVNLVPVDFVVNSMALLSGDADSINNTFHLVDPEPMKVKELQDLFVKKLNKKFLFYPVPISLARLSLKMPVLRNVYQMPVQLVDYFVHQVHYENQFTRDFLSRYGIDCPQFNRYFDVLLKFFIEHDSESLQGIMI